MDNGEYDFCKCLEDKTSANTWGSGNKLIASLQAAIVLFVLSNPVSMIFEGNTKPFEKSFGCRQLSIFTLQVFANLLAILKPFHIG
jgi:hypothetical protein